MTHLPIVNQNGYILGNLKLYVNLIKINGFNRTIEIIIIKTVVSDLRYLHNYEEKLPALGPYDLFYRSLNQLV